MNFTEWMQSIMGGGVSSAASTATAPTASSGISGVTGGGGITDSGAATSGSTPTTTGWQNFSDIMSGIGSMMGAINGFRGLSLAKKQFNFQKDVTTTNLYNQATDYNGQMEDMHLARAAMQGDSAETAQSRIDRDTMKTSL